MSEEKSKCEHLWSLLKPISEGHGYADELMYSTETYYCQKCLCSKQIKRKVLQINWKVSEEIQTVWGNE